VTGGLLCVIPGPSVVYRTEPDERATRWCFTCRKHLPHTWVLLGDPLPRNVEFADWEGLDGWAEASIVMPSYYDPTWSLRCPVGHSDIHFPGSEWL
jgi:hypothetical protein